MLSRRRFIGMLAAAGSLVVEAPPLEAQSGEPMFVIGSVNLNTTESDRNAAAVFRQALHDRGWVAGRNIRFERLNAEGQVDRLPALAAELVRLRVDVILTTSTQSTRAVMDATTSIPIVMFTANALEQVVSLARPGGNVTGVTFFAGTEIAGKQLELGRVHTKCALT